MAEKKKKKESIIKKLKKKIKKRLKKIVKYVGYKWILPLAYKWYCRQPVDEKLVVFADYRDREMPDNFIGLYGICLNNGFRCEVVSGRPFGDSVPKWQRRKAKLKFQFQFQFMKLYALCGAVFFVEHFPLADIVKPREKTKVIQLWHACGLGKRFGYAVTSKKWGISAKEKKMYPMHMNYTLVTSSSKKVGMGYRDAFDCSSDIIKSLGTPRTDIYFDESFKNNARDKMLSLFPEIANRKIILYAPTFRGKSMRKSYIEYDLNFKELKDALADKYAFVTKFHPLMAKKGLSETRRLQGKGFVYDATELLSPEEALCAADILITDYSSIIFEFMLLERPIISFIFDIDQYVADRGLFYPYDELAPGPYVFNQEELIESLLSIDDWFDIERVREYKKEYMLACDGHSTERIYNYVFNKDMKN